MSVTPAWLRVAGYDNRKGNDIRKRHTGESICTNPGKGFERLPRRPQQGYPPPARADIFLIGASRPKVNIALWHVTRRAGPETTTCSYQDFLRVMS
jgi:hypothetical protein